MRSALFGGLSLLLSASCAASGAPQSAKNPLLSAGAPELHRTTLTASGAGPMLSLRDLRGKLVIVDFFAEYCQPCMRSLPELEELHHARPDVALVGVAEDPDRFVSLRVAQELALDFPIVFDQDHVLAGRYRVDGLPATFVLDREGVVRWASDGASSRKELEAVLDSLK